MFVSLTLIWHKDRKLHIDFQDRNAYGVKRTKSLRGVSVNKTADYMRRSVTNLDASVLSGPSFLLSLAVRPSKTRIHRSQHST